MGVSSRSLGACPATSWMVPRARSAGVKSRQSPALHPVSAELVSVCEPRCKERQEAGASCLTRSIAQCQIFFGGITFNERTDVVESHRLRIHDGTNSFHFSSRGDLRHGPRGACPHILVRSPCAVSTVQVRSISYENYPMPEMIR